MIKQTSEYVGPLAGLNVIDFGHYYAGPMAAMNLARLAMAGPIRLTPLALQPVSPIWKSSTSSIWSAMQKSPAPI